MFPGQRRSRPGRGLAAAASPIQGCHRRLAGACWLLLLLWPATTRAQDSAPLPPPDCVRAVRQARIAETAGDLETAERLLTQAMADYPEHILPLQERLRMHRQHKLGDERADELRDEIRRRVLVPDYPLADGSVRFLVRELGDDPEVLEALRQGLEARLAKGQSEELRATKALVEQRLGLWSEARATIDPLISSDSPFEMLSFVVLLDLRLERWQQALELLEPRIDDPVVGPILGAVYLELLAKTGQVDRLMKEIERFRNSEGRLILSDGGYRSLLKEVAWSLYDAGKTESAESIWRTLAEDDPNDVEALLVLANLFSTEEERLAQTARISQQLQEEDNLDQLLTLGTEYLAAGDNQRAYEALSRVAASGSYDMEALWFNLGLAASRLEKWEETANAFRRAVARNRGRADAHSNLAMALFRLDNCADAVESFEYAIRLEPDRTNDYYYLGTCLATLGDAGRSAEAMARYRSLRDGG